MGTTKKEYDKVIAYIVQLIQTGQLKLGEKLPTERALAEELSLSRSSIREAIRSLENMGIVESCTGSGNYLVNRTQTTMSRMMEMMLVLHQVSPEEIISFRKTMDLAACFTIIEHGLPMEARGKLETALQQVRDADTEESLSEADYSFHYALMEAAENAMWITVGEAVAQICRSWIDRCLCRANRETREELAHSHEAIADALKKGDRIACEQWICRHYALVEEEMFRRNKSPWKGIIFDLDGTILDTLEDLADSLNAALKKLELPPRSLEEVRRFVGNGIRTLVERGVPDGTSPERTEQVLEQFTQWYRAHGTEKTKPYSGIHEVMEILKQHGIRIAVVSNKADSMVRELCTHYFGDLVEMPVGERPGVPKKPSPDSVLSVLTAFQMEPEDVVYIGDSEVDLQTAANAGLSCISAAWGFRDAAFLIECGAKTVAQQPSDLLDLLLPQTTEKLSDDIPLSGDGNG